MIGDRRRDVLAVIIPAYNEERAIAEVVRSVPPTLTVDDQTFRTVVIVVEDCSRDATYQNALDAGAIVIRHFINSGAGAATRTGFSYVLKNAERLGVAYVATIDADGQHSSGDLLHLLREAVATKADMLVGNRLHEGNKADMPRHRTLGNRGLSLISRGLFGITTEDTQSGLRMVTIDALPAISRFTIDRYGFCSEILWRARQKNLTVVEVPIGVKYSEETLGKGQSNWGVFDLVTDLITLRLIG
ncbi:glycosyltransferase family 2 protein [Blastococcus haudaquaticus]|uniref:glycosyltransferase family 2 protein n=1 Tax=Blastococcus haudaquaticus TaxID=1938745 RepID=UPI00135B4D0D|nr:glycosyltransferase family 2 protein [Blastococcus haudaquaticus]